mgnify:FL=1
MRLRTLTDPTVLPALDTAYASRTPAALLDVV